MKILFITRSTALDQPGGDTLQMEQTARHLQDLGVQVDLHLAGKPVSTAAYDIVHFFNIIRPADLLPYLPHIRHLVVSSIYVDYSEFDRQHRGPAGRWLHALGGRHALEYGKTMLRHFPHLPGGGYWWRGQKMAMQKILRQARMLIPATQHEARSLRSDFPELPEHKIKVIPLGLEHFEPAPTPAQPAQAVACVARIEGLKNQRNLIRALAPLRLPLHLYGHTAIHQKDYLKKCQMEAYPEVHFAGPVSHQELAESLPRFAVHALPSYFETTGLATLEALKAGCRAVVADRGPQREILGDRAHYCDPNDPDSIRAAVQKALTDTNDHRQWVTENFSWRQAARQILDIYRQIAKTSS